MAIKITNQAASTLNAGINNVATSLAVPAGQGVLFPALGATDWFYGTLQGAAGYEIVKVTGKASDTFTIVRAQEGTTAKSFSAGEAFELRPTVQSVLDMIAIPAQNIQDAAYTFAATDVGSTVVHTAAAVHVWTINSNANLALPVGSTIQLRNRNGALAVTIAITADVLRMAGTGTGGAGVSRTLAANGFATLYKETSTEWVISGAGVS